MRRDPRFALGLLWLLGCACTEFPTIPETGCGNGVVERPTEDCDTFDPLAGSKCREKGTVNECHLDCSPGPDGKPKTCFPGWGCDADSICRAPSGRFIESSPVADVGAWTLTAGDFDGDGRQDVMSSEPLDASGGTRLRFNYFDEYGALVETRLFPKSVLSPTVGQISGDDFISDVAFASGPLGVMYGRHDRTWVPEVFSSYRRRNASVRVVGVYDRAVGQAAPFAIFITFATGTGFYLGNSDNGTLVKSLSVPGSTDELAGDLVSGNLFEDTKHSPCLEPVFAMRGATHFSVVDVCDTDERGAVLWRSKFELTDIALEPPAQIDVAPQVLDMDGDGHLDVLLGAAGRPYVAYGDGSTLGVATPYVLHAEDPDFPTETPLAVADFTGDRAPDFVFPDRLLVSRTAYAGAVPSYQVIGNRQSSPWTLAKVADFNGNGRLDVVAASSGSLNLDFFNGTGTENLSASRISTSAPVQLLSAGDFDGDLITDLALVEVPLPREEESTLKVAFGSAFAPLGAPVAVGRIRGLEALNSYRTAGRDNLTVCSSETIDDRKNGALTLLLGGPDRVPFAPLTLTEFSSNSSVQDASAIALVSGSFIRKNQQDLLALAFFRNSRGLPSPVNVWSVPALTTPGSAPVRLPGELDPRLTPVTFALDNQEYSAGLASTSADLDADQQNEQDPSNERDEAIFAMPADGGRHCGLLFLAADARGSFGSAAREPLIIEEPCADPQILAVKFDDREPAALALLTGRNGAEGRHLYVLWNDGHGQFSALNRTQISLPGDSPQAFTVLPQGGGKIGFAYVTKDSVQLVRPPNKHQFADPETLVRLNNGTGIVAADVNGDHLSDLVVSESGKLRVFRAQLEVP